MLETRDDRIDRLWLRASFIVWILISGVILLAFLTKEARYGGWDTALSDLPIGALAGAIWGGVITLHIFSIPSRIVVNLIVRERRRKQLWETVACVIAFVSLTLAAYSYIAYPLE